MSEVLKTATVIPVDNIPLMLTAASAAVGVAANYIVERSKSQEDQRIAESTAQQAENMQPTLIKRLNRSGLGLIAVAVTTAGGINSYNYLDNEEPVETQISGQLVGDRSGATKVGEEDNTPADRVTKVLAQFDAKKGYRFTAQIGKSSDNSEQPISEIIKARPFGAPNLRQAYNDAISTFSDTNSSNDDEKTPIVMITNGNTFGNVDSVIAKGKDVNASVYVVNVADDTKDSEGDLKRIAEETGGEYWNASNVDDVENVASAVKEGSKTNKAEEAVKEQPNKPYKVFGFLALIAVPLTIRSVRNSREADQLK